MSTLVLTNELADMLNILGTGSLGSYLLDTLILSSKVSKVYCLNRRPNAEEYQAEVNRSRGLISKWDRVEFFHVDLSKPSFGLEESLYERLRDETSAIIRELKTVLRWNGH